MASFLQIISRVFFPLKLNSFSGNCENKVLLELLYELSSRKKKTTMRTSISMENYLLDLVVAAIEKTEQKVFAIPTEEESLKLFFLSFHIRPQNETSSFVDRSIELVRRYKFRHALSAARCLCRFNERVCINNWGKKFSINTKQSASVRPENSQWVGNVSYAHERKHPLEMKFIRLFIIEWLNLMGLVSRIIFIFIFLRRFPPLFVRSSLLFVHRLSMCRMAVEQVDMSFACIVCLFSDMWTCSCLNRFLSGFLFLLLSLFSNPKNLFDFVQRKSICYGQMRESRATTMNIISLVVGPFNSIFYFCFDISEQKLWMNERKNSSSRRVDRKIQIEKDFWHFDLHCFFSDTQNPTLNFPKARKKRSHALQSSIRCHRNRWMPRMNREQKKTKPNMTMSIGKIVSPNGNVFACFFCRRKMNLSCCYQQES